MLAVIVTEAETCGAVDIDVDVYVDLDEDIDISYSRVVGRKDYM